MDATVLYMMVKLTNGVEYAVMAAPMDSERACIRSARKMKRGRIAARYRAETGGKVSVYCSAWKRPTVIAR